MKAAKKVVRKTAAKKVASKKTAGKKVAAQKVAARKPAAKKVAAKKPAAKKAVSKPAKKVTKRPAARKPRARSITPEQALANTFALLDAKHEHDRQVQPWQAIGQGTPGVSQPGFQSEEAAQKAGELHAAESRMPAIHGSIGTQGRHNQGKRDKR